MECTDGEQSLASSVLESVDWDEFRKLSLGPGGFQNRRTEIWPKLLHVKHAEAPDASAILDASILSDADTASNCDMEQSTESVHRDERQIGLDTERSFVLYPVDSNVDREHRQSELHELIVSVFRKRQHLSYFQGYHDVISVLFLTLPRELQLPCAEKLSLLRLRDSMGASLEPVVGLLRILRRLLHCTDPSYASLLERHTSLPYFALSQILTLFSHDIPTLPLIQHVFDYLLCRPPIAVVYLVAAVALSRREEVQMLEKEGEDGMTHSLLSSLPELYEEDEQSLPIEKTLVESVQIKTEITKTETEIKMEEVEVDIKFTIDTMANSESDTVKTNPSLSEDTLEASLGPGVEQFHTEPSADDGKQSPVEEHDMSFESVRFPDPLSPPPPSEPVLAPDSLSLSEEKPRAPSTTPSTSPSIPIHVSHRPRVSLTSLFLRADELYTLYPPTHPSIALSAIMGPQSAMFTWSENPAELPTDDDAELMVTKPELVVRPYIEPSDAAASEGEYEKHPEHRRQRKLHKPRRLDRSILERKTVVAGAVLVLGVALIVYGMQASYPPSLLMGNGHHSRHTVSKELKRVSQFLGGVLLGVGERAFGGIL